MDQYGIANGVRTVVRVYEQMSRGTGRTSRMIEALKSGDRVVFADEREARRVKHICQDCGLDIECVTMPPEDPGLLMHRPPSIGRTVFDHSWVMARYVYCIEQVGREIARLEKAASRGGEAPESQMTSTRMMREQDRAQLFFK